MSVCCPCLLIFVSFYYLNSFNLGIGLLWTPNILEINSALSWNDVLAHEFGTFAFKLSDSSSFQAYISF
jgi:hypothetical protein